ncbi:hypothetical protein ACT2E5_05705 [Burkholderia vietnamiensis]|uniref:hypothetical protein n=1 Tax=Burkholderia vietnamiensis TaxID=60552 RepID=UPI00402AFA88
MFERNGGILHGYGRVQLRRSARIEPMMAFGEMINDRALDTERVSGCTCPPLTSHAQ